MEKMIACSIPTRGDVGGEELDMILTSMEKAIPGMAPYDAFYRNNERINFGVFSRYVHADSFHQANYIYTQDDDCLVDIPALFSDPAVGNAMLHEQVICNMPEAHYENYKHTPEKLVGFGCLFPSSIIAPTFNTYLAHFPLDMLLLREADRIFTGLNRDRTIVTHHPVQHLPYADSPSRMYREPGHESFRHLARARVLQILNLTS